MITVPLLWLVVIGLGVFAAGFVIAALLAAAGMASRDRERIAGRRVPKVTIREKL
jgi:hypothetical protein